MRVTSIVTALALLIPACSGDDGSGSDATSAAPETTDGTVTTSAGETASNTDDSGSETGTASNQTTTSTTTTGPETTDGPTGDPDPSTAGPTTDPSTGSTTAGANEGPEIISDPPLELVLWEALGGNFTPGQIFLAGSTTNEIRVYDKDTLEFVQSFTHPSFNDYSYNPRGMSFNELGNLVVATYTEFLEFSDYGVVDQTYPKEDPEPTENVIFDELGNLYTTTATGGSGKLNQYSADGYVFAQTIDPPPGAGQLTGITFDDEGRLYLASQSGNAIHVAQANEDFSQFMWVDSFAGQGPAVRLEGLVFNRTGELVVAQADLNRYDVMTGTVVGQFDVPQDVWPVPVSVDNSGNIYTSDFENGNGTLPADIVRFDSVGENPLAINDPDLYGPFGLAISGTVLASDPPVLYTYQVEAVDPEDDPLTFALLEAPDDMTIDMDTGLIEWLVTSQHIGAHPVTVEVSDDHGNTAEQMFIVEIQAE